MQTAISTRRPASQPTHCATTSRGQPARRVRRDHPERREVSGGQEPERRAVPWASSATGISTMPTATSTRRPAAARTPYATISPGQPAQPAAPEQQAPFGDQERALLLAPSGSSATGT